MAAPDVVVHELTAIPDAVDPRKLDQQFVQTNRLRTEGTDHLLEAARAVGVRRFVAQSFASWVYARTGGPVKVESDPIETDPPASVRQTLAGIVHVERTLAEAIDLEGIALRYGGFYGPGTSLGEGGPVLEMVRKRRFPIVGSGGGIWSFIHIDDAAAATAAAIERGGPGNYNVTDDDPASVATWLPELADAIGAPAAPRSDMAGEVARRAHGRGDDDRPARRVERKGEARARWQPQYASWREGFRTGLE